MVEAALANRQDGLWPGSAIVVLRRAFATGPGQAEFEVISRSTVHLATSMPSRFGLATLRAP